VKPTSSGEPAEPGLIARHYRPGPPLAALVDLFWYYRGLARPHGKERLLPTGTQELVINLRENRIRTYDADRLDLLRELPGSVMSGPHSRYFVLDTRDESDVIGVHFKPGGAFPFLRPPAGELRDRQVGLEALWGETENALLRERLLQASGADAKFAVLEQALLRQLRHAPERHGAVAQALRCLDQAPRLRTIAEVSAGIGLSSRRFIELFTAQVGLTPKLYCRVRRFQRVLQAVWHKRRVDWSAVALDCGYYDQAHFIRDFRAFSGLNPSAFLDLRGDCHDYLNHVGIPD
jgi:AraC-like DNA-binding protein